MVFGGTESVEGTTCWYLEELGQNWAVLVASIMSFQKIYDLHGLNHQIFEYSKKEKVITDKQTDPFCGRGRVKIFINICYTSSANSSSVNSK